MKVLHLYFKWDILDLYILLKMYIDVQASTTHARSDPSLKLNEEVSLGFWIWPKNLTHLNLAFVPQVCPERHRNDSYLLSVNRPY